MKNLRSPKASLAKIQLLVCFTAFLLLLLTFSSASRRWNNNPKLRILLWAAYALSSYFITYTLGLMTEASFRNELLPLWAIFLMIFFGSADCYSASSLEDCEQWKNYSWQYVIRTIGVLILLLMYGIMSPVILVLFVLRLMGLFKRTTKLIADYMSSEHRSSEGDPDRMRGYNYIVRGEETSYTLMKKSKEREAPNYRMSLEITDRAVTIEKVWNCQGWLFKSGGGDEDSKLKDICLSFSLYKLLRLRFSSYSLPKQAHEKVWKLIQHLYAEGNGYERTFGLIEQELSFLYDLFYTNRQYTFQPSLWKVKVVELLLLVIGSLVTIGLCFLRYYSYGPQDDVQLATAGGRSIDVLVTALVLIIFVLVEPAQLSTWPSRTGRRCHFVQLIGLICRMRTRKHWERKLCQYSLLESCDYTPAVWLYNRITALYIDQTRDGQNQSTPAELSLEVKQAVLRSLMSNPPVLENGKASLRLNEVEDKLSWACRLETQTQVITVWHIATSICEHRMQISDSNFHVATCLSKYLAYLVAFCPKLLPDHPYDAEYNFDRIIFKSRKLFKGCDTKDERIGKLMEIDKTRDDKSSVIIQGAKLGRLLLGVEKGKKFIWKVLAEFWAELMVYVAPHDTKTHAEHLVMGGEFVTHLWSLVSPAGIA
ncbi:hypothetical protein EUGRSUZ_D01497 [Eucalyptus grandis]|uniref:DUF4220 domain-containing protein n=2 Tax=Eucalyptus grandis TaxID=71139 RepID=A0A059CG46_EUCGR|nr:hypothetical protein EUGRSUZ_D01497 [Eucalyptus grandis]